MAVAVSVAATDTTAVLPAVISMAFSGTGNLKLNIGISTVLTPVFVVSSLSASTPFGGRKLLGSTTIGV